MRELHDATELLEAAPPPSLAASALALAVATIVASVTLAGPSTPCAEFLPAHQRCQFTTGWFDRMLQLCIGQILLISVIPLFVSAIAAPASRWRGGAHLLALGVVGAAVSTIVALFIEWPIGPRTPIHLLGLPVLTSLVVLATLWLERLIGWPSGCAPHIDPMDRTTRRQAPRERRPPTRRTWTRATRCAGPAPVGYGES